MARHALLDRPAPVSAAEETRRLPPLHSADTAALFRAPIAWPTVDPDADDETARARHALRQPEPLSTSLLERVLAGLRNL